MGSIPKFVVLRIQGPFSQENKAKALKFLG